MTGLNKEVDHLLEIACLVTDANLQIVAEVIRHSKTSIRFCS